MSEYFKPFYRCLNCDEQRQDHIDDKCPFASTTFKENFVEGWIEAAEQRYWEKAKSEGNWAAQDAADRRLIKVERTPGLPGILLTYELARGDRVQLHLRVG